MARVTALLLIICFNAGLSYGMDCSFGQHKNVLSKIIDSCPGLLDSEDKSYCCYDLDRDKVYCCDAQEFLMKSSWFLLTAIVVVVVIVSLISCCISCLCCSCCPWYRRRRSGTVYGRVQVPGVVHVIQTPASVPQPAPQYTNTAYATSSTEVTQPPAYSEVVYEKQAPYNPNYPTHPTSNIKCLLIYSVGNVNTLGAEFASNC